jgi:AbrB family transcriptional regulator (stage V sporulation protein T)
LKTTGVSRRIDELGRIVIPKEIRKNLKIRNGELLEIMVDGENIILTKHSSMKGIGDTAKLCVDAVNDALNINMLVTDRDTVVAASQSLRKKYLDKDISIELGELILRHQAIIERESKKLKIDVENEEYTPYVAYPIVVDGDVAGSVIIMAEKIREEEEKTAEIIAKFLSRNIM